MSGKKLNTDTPHPISGTLSPWNGPYSAPEQDAPSIFEEFTGINPNPWSGKSLTGVPTEPLLKPSDAPATSAANVAMGMSPTPAGKPDAEKPLNQGGGEDTTEEDAENVRLLREMQFGLNPGGARGAAYFRPEGESKAGVGGEELYKKAFVDAPARRQEAMSELGRVQSDRATELAGMYDQQVKQDQAAARAMEVRRQEEQHEIARRQEEVAKATKYYSRELRDSGKFWANPGNIVAAISYSLMPIFSNDPTVGVKLINQAVQQDLDNRTRAADMEIGNARANLDGYRKIAGDRQQGDLLARAEAHRMASQEIARVGQKYSGPEAAKNIQIAIEDQNTRAAAAEMEFYAKYIHKDAAQVPKGLHDATFKGPGGWHQYGVPGGGPASPVNGTIGGGPSQVPNAPLKNNHLQAIARSGGAGAVDKALDDPRIGKVSSADLENTAKMLLWQEAQRKSPGNPGAAYDVLRHAEEEKLAPVAMKLQETSTSRHRVAKVRATMEQIERSERAAGNDPEDFLSWTRNGGVWPKAWILEYEKITASDPARAGDKNAVAKAYREERAKELRAALRGVFNSHAHDLFGGAQSAQELANAAMEVGEKSSFRQTQTFLDGRSQELQKQNTDTKASLSPYGRILLRLRTEGGASSTNLPSKGIRQPVRGDGK